MTFVILVFTVGALSMLAVFGLCVAWMESRPRRTAMPKPQFNSIRAQLAFDAAEYEPEWFAPSISELMLWQTVLEAEDRARLEQDAARLIYELSVEGDVLLANERADRDEAA
jgi:hypothetical protein